MILQVQSPECLNLLASKRGNHTWCLKWSNLQVLFGHSWNRGNNFVFLSNFGREDFLLDVWWSTHFFMSETTNLDSKCMFGVPGCHTDSRSKLNHLPGTQTTIVLSIQDLVFEGPTPKTKNKWVPGIYHGTSTIESNSPWWHGAFDGSVKTFCNLSGEGSWFLKSGYDSCTLR